MTTVLSKENSQKPRDQHSVICASCDFETFITAQNPPEHFICAECSDLLQYLAMLEDYGLKETAAAD